MIICFLLKINTQFYIDDVSDSTAQYKLVGNFVIVLLFIQKYTFKLNAYHRRIPSRKTLRELLNGELSQ